MVLTVLAKLSVYEYVVLSLVGVLLVLVSLTYIMRKSLGFLPSVFIRVPDFKFALEVAKFGIPIAVTSLGFSLFLTLDKYFITYFIPGTEALGAYSILTMFLTYFIVFGTNMSVIIVPTASKLWDKDRSHFIELFHDNQRIVFSIITIIAIITTAINEVILRIYFINYPIEYFIIFLLLLAAGAVFGYSILYSHFIVGIGFSKVHMNFYVIVLFVNVILDYLLVQIWGALGVALGTLISSFLMLFLRLSYSLRIDKRLISLQVIKGALLFISMMFFMIISIKYSLSIYVRGIIIIAYILGVFKLTLVKIEDLVKLRAYLSEIRGQIWTGIILRL
jgi:O-antigen/teichoic acid export membrane protein